MPDTESTPAETTEAKVQILHAGAFGLRPPENFTFSNPGEWPRWISTLKDYAFMAGLHSAGDEAQKELDDLESQDVLRKVATPSEWCFGLVVEPKSSGGYRICVDLTKLNEVIERERFNLPMVEQILGQLGGAGCDYVLIVDYYSRFPEVVSVGYTMAPAVILAIKSCIAHFGIPDIVRIGNGPQFVSNEFAEFARSYGFRLETSSPRYPQSNGEAERMVRTVKDLLFKGPDRYLALLSYRDTPGPSGIFPAQALMGRKLQTRLLKLPEQLLPSLLCHTSFMEKDSWNKARQAMTYNRRHVSSQLAPLSPRGYVWVTDARCNGEVLSQAQRPRSYFVQTPRGVLQRIRRHLVLHSSEATPAQLAASSPVPPEVMQPAAPQEDTTQPEVTPQETVTQTRSARIVRPPRRLDL
ncbi:uncharacterized protein LOC142582099 [Dermacentor variabilis]|uniref:uncharacterized protein LOC142582099 n=1 Tax=Dermacentor variabilis TaxID=34621 RepID=UPI003F5AFF03